MLRKKERGIVLAATFLLGVLSLTGCSGNKSDTGKTVIELVHYKPEAVSYFEEVEKQFNASHKDIELKISSPNDAMTVLKTRFIREDKAEIFGH